MSASSDKLRELISYLDVLRTYYTRLSERERYIVLGSVAAGVVFVMIVIYTSLLATASSKAGSIERSRANLAAIQELRNVYQQTQRQIGQLEQMIRRTTQDFQLATHLEQLAQKNGVIIDSVKNRPVPPNDHYQEKQVSVSVRQVTLRTLTDFLYEIENSRQLLRISSLQVKPNFQDPTQLNVTFVVSTFQPSEAP